MFENLIITGFNFGLFGAMDVVHGTEGYVNANNPESTVDYKDGAGLSAELKTFYSARLIDMAEAKLVHAQFGQKEVIPSGSGKSIEFRKYDSLPKALTPLTEGVTPSGSKMNVTTLTATLNQYGDYVALTDVLDVTGYDKNIIQATKLIASQAGRTLDSVVREVINAGTNVQYADGSVASRSLLVGGAASGNNYLTVEAVRKAVRTLKAQNAEPFEDGYYVAIIHPNVTHDLMTDPDWEKWSVYTEPEKMYKNEVGRIAGVRFVETTEAKIFEGAGQSGRDVYSTLIIAQNAYGVTEITGLGLKHIVKQLGSGGTSDPLDQRSTVGWKAMQGAVILVNQYMVRIETTSEAE